ncbi:MAG: DivIVA domain-containing protein [Anaeromassilibacillus sp.]|nr:DivIVA domain-containing protein [Anaeromassilibacillus sp.]MDY3780067.1 DivIVA domain-containing protein [Candidatus Limousia pullorum]
MLTIDEIKNISFRKANRGGGYHPDDVDSFIDDVVATFEQMKREKSDLIRKMDILANRIEKYRADEEIVRNALISSQRISDETIKDANEKAEGIIKDAEARAQLMVMDANKAVLAKKDEMLKLEKDAADLRDAVLAMYKKHIEVISELPTQQDVEELNEKLYDSKEEETAPVEQEAETVSEELLTDVQPSEVEFEGEVITEAPENEMEGNNEVQE